MKKHTLIIFLLVFALGLSGCGLNKSQNSSQHNKVPKDMENLAKMNNYYQDFTPEKLSEVQGNKKFIAFFHAEWCKTCRRWEKKIFDAAKDLPQETIILKVDYDNQKSLVQDLGVKSQSTAVFFNENGDIVEKDLDPSIKKVINFFSEEVAKKDIKQDSKEVEMMKDKDENEKEEKSIEKNSSAMIEQYSQELRESLSNEKHLIFFHADWCSACRKWKTNITKKLTDLPPSTKILVADYNSENDLKKEFNITSQTVAVFVKEDGSFETKLDPKSEEVARFFNN